MKSNASLDTRKIYLNRLLYYNSEQFSLSFVSQTPSLTFWLVIPLKKHFFAQNN